MLASRREAPRALARTIALSFALSAPVSCGGGTSRPPEIRRAPPPRWDSIDAARAFVSMGAKASRGHGVESFLVEVRASPVAEAPYRTLGPHSLMPRGSVLVAFHTRPNGAPSSVYAMTKQNDDTWEYLVAEADGTLVAKGPLPACDACHREGTADRLFGVVGLPNAAGAPAGGAGN